MIRQVFEIPTDVMADAARLILQSGAGHRIIDAGEEYVKMELLFEESSDVKGRMQEIINDYNHYRYGDSE